MVAPDSACRPPPADRRLDPRTGRSASVSKKTAQSLSRTSRERRPRAAQVSHVPTLGQSLNVAGIPEPPNLNAKNPRN